MSIRQDGFDENLPGINRTNDCLVPSKVDGAALEDGDKYIAESPEDNDERKPVDGYLEMRLNKDLVIKK